MGKLNLLQLSRYPILEQLRLEEALLRADMRNWCVINEGTPPAIVMGISGKPEHLINLSKLKNDPVPVIKRFSGGGTVFVDENTWFVTFICNADAVQTACCPVKVLQWTEKLYQPVFSADFALRENDYVMGNKKFGGNAQYLCKDRWLHHSSLLWDFHSHRMEYLLQPPKMPHYREKRSHDDFLCRLKEHHSGTLREDIIRSLKNQFEIEEWNLDSVQEILKRPHRQATTVLTL